MRGIVAADLTGKTIRAISNGAVNVLTLYFTDGTHVELWAEDAINIPAGSIPGIFIEGPYPTGAENE